MNEESLVNKDNLNKRIKHLERSLEERDKANKGIIEAYEARVNKLKADLDFERKEKLQILQDFSDLKDKFNQEVKKNPQAEILEIFKEKS